MMLTWGRAVNIVLQPGLAFQTTFFLLPTEHPRRVIHLFVYQAGYSHPCWDAVEHSQKSDPSDEASHAVRSSCRVFDDCPDPGEETIQNR